MWLDTSIFQYIVTLSLFCNPPTATQNDLQCYTHACMHTYSTRVTHHFSPLSFIHGLLSGRKKPQEKKRPDDTRKNNTNAKPPLPRCLIAMHVLVWFLFPLSDSIPTVRVGGNGCLPIGDGRLGCPLTNMHLVSGVDVMGRRGVIGFISGASFTCQGKQIWMDYDVFFVFFVFCIRSFLLIFLLLRFTGFRAYTSTYI